MGESVSGLMRSGGEEAGGAGGETGVLCVAVWLASGRVRLLGLSHSL